MLRNVCTAGQNDHRKHPFLHVGNDGGETEPQLFKKNQNCGLSFPPCPSLWSLSFLKEKLQKQRVICVAHSVPRTTNRGTETIYFEYKWNNNYRLWSPVGGFRIWSCHSKHYYTVIILIRASDKNRELSAVLIICLCPRLTTNHSAKNNKESTLILCAMPQQALIKEQNEDHMVICQF